MLTRLELAITVSPGAALPGGSVCIALGRRARVPPGKPWPRHLLVGGPHRPRPTAEPGGRLASCCWGHNPLSPAPYLAKAVRGKFRGVKEDVSHFTLIWLWCLLKAESDRPQPQTAGLLNYSFLPLGPQENHPHKGSGPNEYRPLLTTADLDLMVCPIN